MKSLQLLLVRTVLAAVLALVSVIGLADSIRLAVTTSTYNSGLSDNLLSHYARVSNTQVQVISVGTGKALKMGENGDVDLVMTHAPSAEARFIDQGFGIEAQRVMHNDFVLVGPKDDKAKVSGARTVTQGLSLIKASNNCLSLAVTTQAPTKENCSYGNTLVHCRILMVILSLAVAWATVCKWHLKWVPTP